MIFRQFCILLLVLFVLPTLGFAQDNDPLLAAERHQQGLFERIAPSVIFIAQGGSMGSGFFVNNEGLALTNAHVVGKSKEVQVVLRDGKKFKAKVLRVAKNDVDLALIQVPIKNSIPVELGGFVDLKVGSWVASVGHSSGGIWTFTTGMISNIYPSEKNEPVFQTQIPVNPGASGGPVFDRKGRVIGVITAGLLQANSINFAIRTDAAIQHFDELQSFCECLIVQAPAGVPIFVNQQMVGKGPKVVLPVEAGSFEVFAVIKGKMTKKTVAFPQTRAVTLE